MTWLAPSHRSSCEEAPIPDTRIGIGASLFEMRSWISAVKLCFLCSSVLELRSETALLRVFSGCGAVVKTLSAFDSSEVICRGQGGWWTERGLEAVQKKNKRNDPAFILHLHRAAFKDGNLTPNLPQGFVTFDWLKLYELTSQLFNLKFSHLCCHWILIQDENTRVDDQFVCGVAHVKGHLWPSLSVLHSWMMSKKTG